MPPQLPVVVGLKREAYQVIYYIWTISAIYLFIAPELYRNFQFSKTKFSKLKLVQMGNRNTQTTAPTMSSDVQSALELLLLNDYLSRTWSFITLVYS